MAAEEWPWKEVLGPAIAGAIGLVGGWFANRSREKTESGRRDIDHEVAQIGYDQAQMTTITERFKTLLDGYERRITDLKAEVQDLRVQLEEAKAHIRDHMNGNAAS